MADATAEVAGARFARARASNGQSSPSSRDELVRWMEGLIIKLRQAERALALFLPVDGNNNTNNNNKRRPLEWLSSAPLSIVLRAHLRRV